MTKNGFVYQKISFKANISEAVYLGDGYNEMNTSNMAKTFEILLMAYNDNIGFMPVFTEKLIKFLGDEDVTYEGFGIGGDESNETSIDLFFFFRRSKHEMLLNKFREFIFLEELDEYVYWNRLTDK